MPSRIQTIENLEACYRSMEALMDSLSDDDWAVQSLCPDWDAKGVITHLAAVEHMLNGWMPETGDSPLPFDKVMGFTEQAAGWSPQQLADETRGVFATRRAELASTTDEQFAAPSMTPIGKATYHRFMDVRAFDFWVHERDITTPLGRTTDDGGPVAEVALDEVHGSIGYIVGKKIGLPDGMSVAFRLTGPVERNIYAKVDGRAAGVDSLDDPTVEVTTDSVTFVQLACGRIDPQAQIDAGKISWSGDAEWGEKAARNLQFTM
ncbi:MAG: maleylpyruvate isomerase family mycothiol-dependent enzyme [Acidimicrobiales bacterium]